MVTIQWESLVSRARSFLHLPNPRALPHSQHLAISPAHGALPQMSHVTTHSRVNKDLPPPTVGPAWTQHLLCMARDMSLN